MSKTAITTVPLHPLLAERWSPRGFDRNHEINDDTLTALLEAFPALDAADWGQRVAAARSEHERTGAGGAASRELFRALRELLG